MKTLLHKLTEKGIILEEDQGKLKVHFSKDEINAELLNEVKKHKERLLIFLKENSHKYKNIPKAKAQNCYPLSNAQKRLWTLCQFEATSIAYNMPSYIVFNKGCDTNRLKIVIKSLVNRHESLRTIFKLNEAGEIRQHIIPTKNIKININFIDLRPESDKEVYVEKYIITDTYMKFNLEKGPLFRLSLFQFTEEKFILYFNFHHIICDGWSINILKRDLLHYYTNYPINRQVDLPKLKIQYKDYAVWKENQVNNEINKSHQRYWLNEFQNKSIELIKLPSWKIRPKFKTHNGRRLGTHISIRETTRFREFCNKNGGSLFMGLLAVWNILLYKYTNQKDIILGTPSANRNHIDLKNQVGFYVNTLALRNTINPEESFNNFFFSVKEKTMLAIEHQDYPFDKLIEDLNLKWDLSRSPMFDIMIKLLNTGESHIDNAEVRPYGNEVVDLGKILSRFDLNVSFEEIGNGLNFNITYNTDIYDRKMIENLILHYKYLSSQLLTNPNEKIKNIKYLNKNEEYNLIHKTNNTHHDYSNEKTLVDLLEETAFLTPDKISIIDKEKSVTYRDLNERSNQIGALLKKNGVGKGHYVCIHMNRSIELIQGIFGTIKTGAAYLPLEPATPQERKAQILNDLKEVVVITDSKNINELLVFICKLKKNVKIICIEGTISIKTKYKNISIFDLSTVKKEPTTNLDCYISPSDEAYVIFTSGSTGEPKGVVVQHKPVINLIEWVNKTYNVRSNDKLLFVTSISFDLSVYDIFGMVEAGGTIRVANNDELKNPEKLVDIIYKEAITFWDSAPAAFTLIFDELISRQKKEKSGFLRLIFLSGDWVPLSIPKGLKKYLPNVSTVVLGGATEAVIWSNHFLVKEIKKNWSSIPYGKPIWNAKYYILDSHLNPCSFGVEGDLYIGGEVLANRYKGDKKLTSKKFIQNPFIKGERIYKTGDRARYFYDGNIEFLGRLDSQVKIRGHRIELEELKYIIEKNNNIKNAFVTTVGEKENKQLVVYFTQKKKISIENLRAFIKDKIPNYMNPSFLIPIDKFPITLNGKINIQELPNPQRYITKTKIVKPKSKLEKKIVLIWSEIINVPFETIGIESNFFELGGDSIKAMKVISRIKKEFKISIDYERLFLSPNIKTLADYISIVELLKEEPDKDINSDKNLIF